MLRLSKKVDYALMAMVHLSRLETSNGSASAREIAERYAIPSELLAKILQRLAQENLVVSRQGTKGGYSLSRVAEGITAAQVIEAVEGPLSLVTCFTDTGSCEQFDLCNIKSPIQSLNDQVVQLLGSVSLAQMREREEQGEESRGSEGSQDAMAAQRSSNSPASLEDEIRLPVVG